MASQVALALKNPLANARDTWVQSLGWEDSLEEGMETHSSILAQRILMDREPGGLKSVRLQRVGHNWVTKMFSFVWLFETPWTAARQASLSCSNSWILSRWCHPIMSSSVIPFSSCLQYFPKSGSFPVSQFFPSGGQSLELQLQYQSFQWMFRTDFL